jgi:serine/threonine-protein kinase
LTQLLHAGRLCQLYRAAQANGAKPGAYVVKLLNRECESDPAAVACIRREAQAGQAICHPHLVPVLTSHTSAAPYYLVLPWLEGIALSRELDRLGVLSPTAAIWITRQVAEALDALHQAGWVHGDVKPDNILLSPQGHATLVDLGFAHRSGEGSPAGTPLYMAPEQFAGGCTDIRSDLYSLGVTLFEMLTGAVPFDSKDPAELTRQHRGARAAGVRRNHAHLPREVAALVARLLAKEPLRRPQSPRELIQLLVPLEISLLDTSTASP